MTSRAVLNRRHARTEGSTNCGDGSKRLRKDCSDWVGRLSPIAMVKPSSQPELTLPCHDCPFRSQVLVVVGWYRGAISHLGHLGNRCNAAGERSARVGALLEG